MYLFFDTETTGLPNNWNAPVTDVNNWPRLVQIAWLIFDKQGNKLAENMSVIRPNGFIIPKEASDIHKITQDEALAVGENLELVLNNFYIDVNDSAVVIAHNISYDEKIIGAEFIRNNMKNIIDSKNKVCTMKSTTNYCKIQGPYGYKWPKLIELYEKLFDEEFNQHDALDDIRATARCYWELKRRGIL